MTENEGKGVLKSPPAKRHELDAWNERVDQPKHALIGLTKVKPWGAMLPERNLQ